MAELPDDQQINVPDDDIPLEKARKAETSKIVRLTTETASKEYVDTRFSALSEVLQASSEPALALIPPSTVKRDIQEKIIKFEELV